MSELVLGYVARRNAALLPAQTRVIGRRLDAAIAPRGTSRAGFHRQVIACCRRVAFLPARFGVCAAPSWLAQCVAAEDAIDQALADLNRRVELVIGVAQDTSTASDGRGYLALRRREEERLAALAAEWTAIAERLQGRTEIQRRGRLMDVTMLLSPDDVLEAVSQISASGAAAADDIVIRVTGPWPPYRFAAARVPEFA